MLKKILLCLVALTAVFVFDAIAAEKVGDRLVTAEVKGKPVLEALKIVAKKAGVKLDVSRYARKVLEKEKLQAIQDFDKERLSEAARKLIMGSVELRYEIVGRKLDIITVKEFEKRHPVRGDAPPESGQEVDEVARPLDSWIEISDFDFNKSQMYLNQVTVSGIAKHFPDSTILNVNLLFEGKQVASGKVMVMAHKFKWTFNAGGRKYFLGKYQAHVVFRPGRRQAPEVIDFIKRKFGEKRARDAQTASVEKQLGTEEKKNAEIEEMRNDFKLYLKKLYKLFEKIPEEFEAFKPAEGKRGDERAMKKQENEWIDFKMDLYEEARKVKDVFTDKQGGKYADYVIRRFEDSCENIARLCDALTKLCAVESMKGYKAWGVKPPEIDVEYARLPVGYFAPRYIDTHYLQPILQEMDIKPKEIGKSEEKKEDDKDK